MANKYIIHGATYCGDGTASNEAASAGAAGAWNNINVFEGTAPAYGTLAAGDTVYIRSNDSSNASITRAITTITVGSASATWAGPITWILDGGSVWSGVNGQLKYSSTSSTGSNITLRAFNNIIAETRDAFIINVTNTAPNQNVILTLSGNSYCKNLKFDYQLGTTSNGSTAVRGAANLSTLEDCTFKCGRVVSSGLFSFGNTNVGVTLVNPDIELFVTATTYLFSTHSTSSAFRVYGGRLYGAGATTGVYIGTGISQQATLEAYGFTYPNTIGLTPSVPSAFSGVGGIYMFGADGNVSAGSASNWGEINTRQDDNYPTLSAVLPDSDASPWSYKIYPANAHASQFAEVILTKLHTGDDAQISLDIEFLVANSITNLHGGNVWITGQYIGTDNVPVSFSTFDLNNAALDVSTAAWSATTYGAVTLLKKVISYTTPTAVKKDTAVNVRFCCAKKSASANDILFLNPDF